MSHSLFISDLHLSDDRPDTLALFLNFLDQHASQARHLYILGDLFDAWVGDDDDSRIAAEVCEGIRKLTHRGTEVLIMHGNRDFLIGERFCQACRAKLLNDPTVITIADKRLLLTHGDQLCTHDIAYQKARKMRMQPDWLQQFLQKSLAERKAIAAEYRIQSGEAKSTLSEEIMDVTAAEVDNWFIQYNADIMIHGHTHRPAKHEHKVNNQLKTRVVLAEWHEHSATAISINEHLGISQITFQTAE